jgi:hypothetical protein
MFELIGNADVLLERSWQERNWATFIRLWLMATFCLTVFAFVMPFVFVLVPESIYNASVSLVTAIFGGAAKLIGPAFTDILWTMAVPLCALVGVCVLIFTVPVMLMKQLSGDLNSG